MVFYAFDFIQRLIIESILTAKLSKVHYGLQTGLERYHVISHKTPGSVIFFIWDRKREPAVLFRTMMRNDTLMPMGFYDKYLLPRIVHLTCGQNPTMRQREKVVPLATGRVLEIGIGSGLNIPFYNAKNVDHLWGLDPSAEMWSIAQKNAQEHHLDAEFLQSGA